MTPQQYNDLLDLIEKDHKTKGKHIKYVETTFDNRTQDYYYIKIRCLASPPFELSATNENRGIDVYEEALKFLNS